MSDDFSPVYTERLLAEAPPFVEQFLGWLKNEAGDGQPAAPEAVAAHLAEIPDPDEDMRLLWGGGPMPARLDWLMHSTQLGVYREYREWEAEVARKFREGKEQILGKHPRAFVLDWGRRTGKDAFSCMIADEDARRRPNQLILYFTAFAVDINEIVLPLFEIIHRYCPEDLRPVYKGSHQGKRPGLYYPNNSCIRLVGVDKNPNGLRGRFLDKGIGSECGFVDHLKKVIKTVLEPQMLGRDGASMLLNSTPPDVPGHFWDTDVCEDAKDRKAYSLKTIDDNPMISHYERELELESKGGREDPDVQREYFCIRTRDAETTVIPEFDEKKHVQVWPVPEYAHCYTVFDPGVDDMCGIGWFYYDYLNDKIILQRAWAKRNANTDDVAHVIKTTEAELWGAAAAKPLQYQGPKGLQMNPYMRVSDVEKRFIMDLSQLHGLRVSPSRKDDKHAALAQLRNTIKQGRFLVDPSCTVAIQHLRNAIWNKARNSYVRSELYGHFDMVDVCVYAIRAITRGQDPSPSEGMRMVQAAIASGTAIPSVRRRGGDEPQHKARAALEGAFGSSRARLFRGRRR